MITIYPFSGSHPPNFYLHVCFFLLISVLIDFQSRRRSFFSPITPETDDFWDRISSIFFPWHPPFTLGYSFRRLAPPFPPPPCSNFPRGWHPTNFSRRPLTPSLPHFLSARGRFSLSSHLLGRFVSQLPVTYLCFSSALVFGSSGFFVAFRR